MNPLVPLIPDEYGEDVIRHLEQSAVRPFGVPTSQPVNQLTSQPTQERAMKKDEAMNKRTGSSSGLWLGMILLVAIAAVLAYAALTAHYGPARWPVGYDKVLWSPPDGRPGIVVEVHAHHMVGGRPLLQVRLPDGTWKLIDLREIAGHR